ncbi:hypothetical protein L210DRAFT_3507774 [Boletus edulis BED1]|uniref:Uncharacterized protein n=1 Tax=Boletus edulis BED1 TaxID=1328754 RepID=A0AAD4BIP3_BOLED|nr:hypothetical protein L210DRAFT_3507774 [Boletus edulis BED1]
MTEEMKDAHSEGWRRLLWIWLVCGYAEGNIKDESDAGVQDTICIEWCRTQAHVARWGEEVELLFEEQWVICYLDWHVVWWAAKTDTRVVDDLGLAERLKVYAKRQASICHGLKQ